MLTKGEKVTLAGSVINFCLGIFYAWSVFADGLIKEFGWNKAEATFTYTLELLVFRQLTFLLCILVFPLLLSSTLD
ncbi:MAG: hypothetical protein ACQESO_03620 [Bacillota bacterium]